MACKLPVVASPVGINIDIIDNGKNGLLVETQEEWFRALHDIYKKGDITGEYGYKKVREKYNFDVTFPLLFSKVNDCLLNVNENGKKVVRDFGYEWSIFDNDHLDDGKLKAIWEDYFSIFPWDLLPADGGIGMDIGCGTGRWAKFILPNVKRLHLLEPSEKAINVAQNKLKNFDNALFYNESIEHATIESNSLDFAYSLGVLHHVDNIDIALSNIRDKLKKGAPFLIYLYYSMDNKPLWFYRLWKISDYVRRAIIKLPYLVRYVISQFIAITIYLPIVIIGRALRFLKINTDNWPLSYYIDKEFYTMRNDSLDRFATSLENRYSKQDIERILTRNGFTNVKFSEKEPFWCATCVKK